MAVRTVALGSSAAPGLVVMDAAARSVAVHQAVVVQVAVVPPVSSGGLPQVNIMS